MRFYGIYNVQYGSKAGVINLPSSQARK